MALTLFLAFTTACAAQETTAPMTSRQDQFAELMQRPDIEQAITTYERLGAEIRHKATAELGVTWRQSGEGGRSGCAGKYDLGRDVDIAHLPSWRTTTSLPDADWARLLNVIAAVAANYGFDTNPVVVVDKPANHDATFHKPDGAELNVLAFDDAVVGVSTGCHLTAEAHKRGTPTPTPTY